ncbi:MAG TPA: tRNA pseudouridine(55) synthase TruB [Candidatus Margulisiibacteriota bacterium]|nr:tRNA pseudouridine(55) synthase TruB [Candidatus Margulisiibacteriota bacterium]
MHGVLLIDKPEGITSADVVRIVKHQLRCKTGHLGTLDPFASGVLPVCIGDGTKIAQFLNTADKQYTGRIRLGTETDSGDVTGKVTRSAAVPEVRDAPLAELAQRFVGESLQVPPMHSALKHHGVRLYALARQGIAVQRQARRVRIDALQLAVDEPGAVAFDVVCSKGTYVRVLAQDIALALGSVGHLEVLRRVRFGHFHITQAISLDAVGRGSLPVIGLREALRHLREVQLDAGAARRARQGYAPLLRSIPSGASDEAVKLVDPAGALASVILMEAGGQWRFARVFADAPCVEA